MFNMFKVKENNVNYYKFVFIFVIVFIILSSILKILKPYIEPYYNLKFTNYHYQYPDIDKKFIINTEPHDAYIPDFLINILRLSFYDREILIDNKQVPHFIIRCENVKISTEKAKYQAPYITLSAERWTLKRHKYRKNGPPLAEIVSTNPKKKKEFYFPFMIWYGLAPKRIYPQFGYNKIVSTKNYHEYHKKFLAYIASNCIYKREKLFSLIKKLGVQHNLQVDALGMCSNPHRPDRKSVV